MLWQDVRYCLLRSLKVIAAREKGGNRYRVALKNMHCAVICNRWERILEGQKAGWSAWLILDGRWLCVCAGASRCRLSWGC